MKSQMMFNPLAINWFARAAGLILLVASCSDPEIKPAFKHERLPGETKWQQFNHDKTFSGHFNDCGEDGPNYDLNVRLMGAKPNQAGFIAFRQFPSETQFIHLYTFVKGLEPNTSYLLQRAVDTTLDGDCTSASWLTLGKGLDPQSITTNRAGFGQEELNRSVSAIPVGSTFDIHFQIVKESTMEVVLTSDCYEYTIR